MTQPRHERHCINTGCPNIARAHQRCHACYQHRRRTGHDRTITDDTRLAHIKHLHRKP